VISVRTPSTGYALGGSTGGMILAIGETAGGRLLSLRLQELLGAAMPPVGAKVRADSGAAWPLD
jgi:hypothetical protein